MSNWAPLPAPPQLPTAPQQPYYGGAPPPMQKPSSLYKAIGIIQIVLGGAGVFYSLFSLAVAAYTSTLKASALLSGPALALSFVHTSFSVVTGAALLATGFGVFRGKRWARPVGVGYAVSSLLNTFAATAVQILVVQPKLSASMGAIGGAPAFEAIMIVSALFGVLVASVMPVATLIVLLRAQAKQELDG